jgi:hypothetical protein
VRKRIMLIAGAMSMLMVLAMTQMATADRSAQRQAGTRARGLLMPLNNSGAYGHAAVVAEERRLHVHVRAKELAPALPHAMHIHWGEQARHECPNVARDDDNGDFRLTTVEGVPAYGPVRVSLTKSGDTSPDSVLAVNRYPMAPEGAIRYERRMRTQGEVARAIRRGEAVVVIHGVDYNGNGQYDFNSAGESDLDDDLPAEATDPAVCGALSR